MPKVLFITYDFPYPLNSGGKSRSYNLMKFTASEKVDIFLASFIRNSYKTPDNEKLEEIGVEKIWVFKRRKVRNPKVLVKTAMSSSSIFKNLYYDKKFEQKIINIISEERIDIVVFESFYSAFYISAKISKLGVKQIFGTENIEHILYFDFAKSKSKVLQRLYMRQVERVRKEEEKAYGAADCILAVSNEEKEYIEKKTSTPVFVVPNGIETKYFSFKPRNGKTKKLLFVGNFSYFPNIDAIEFFYRNVFQNIPDAELTVVGKNQNKLPFLGRDKRVESIDYVEDIRQIYYNADIFIFPVKFGGGTNFKVLEAASCGTPILAIPDRVKGLGFAPDKHFVSATTATEFMAGIRRLTEDENLKTDIAKNARKLIEEEYDWKEIGRRLEKLFIKLQS